MLCVLRRVIILQSLQSPHLRSELCGPAALLVCKVCKALRPVVRALRPCGPVVLVLGHAYWAGACGLQRWRVDKVGLGGLV